MQYNFWTVALHVFVFVSSHTGDFIKRFVSYSYFMRLTVVILIIIYIGIADTVKGTAGD